MNLLTLWFEPTSNDWQWHAEDTKADAAWCGSFQAGSVADAIEKAIALFDCDLPEAITADDFDVESDRRATWKAVL